VAEAARVAASYVGALQELLDQLLMHWQVGNLSAFHGNSGLTFSWDRRNVHMQQDVLSASQILNTEAT